MTPQETALATTHKQLDLIQTAVDHDPRLPSAHTKRQYKANLRDFVEYLGPAIVTKSLVESYAARLQEAGKAPATINQKLAAIRWYARKLGDMAEEYDPQNAKRIQDKASRVATVRDVTGERLPKGRHLAAGELAALIQACEKDQTAAGRRDAAMFAVAWSCGLRRDELGKLATQDIITGDTPGEADLIIHGKGNKTRSAYLYNGAFLALADWLTVRGQTDGPLFLAINKGGRITGAHLSGEALRKILDKRAQLAGLSQEITWHDFRRTFAGNLLDAGKDLVTVQKLMGHSSSTTTGGYDRRPETARREAVKVLFVPYTRK